MSDKQKKIAEVLAKYGEPYAGNVWSVQGTPVIYHKALERIAAQAKITFDIPTIVRAEKEEAVLMVIGHMGDRVEWSIGEAVIGVNYRVSGKQAAYVWAMAEKRAKDRVILKLIELSGDLYSEEEADEFKQGRPSGGANGPAPVEARSDDAKAYVALAKTAMRNASTVSELDDWWRSEAGKRREYGIVKDTPAFDDLAAAFKEAKESLLPKLETAE